MRSIVRGGLLISVLSGLSLTDFGGAFKSVSDAAGVGDGAAAEMQSVKVPGRALQSGTVVIDTQEWRAQEPRHLYIHGTLNGDTAFQIAMPDPAQWKGRILQFMAGGLGGTESAEGGKGRGYALAHGAVFVQGSQGHIGPAFWEEDDTPKETAYESNYSVMQYAKLRCVELYGREPDFTYAFGNSGGAYRASVVLEMFPKVYDGGVLISGGGQLKVGWSVLSQLESYVPILASKLQALQERVRPGSSGDAGDVLETAEERNALRMLLHAGFPRTRWSGLASFQVARGAIAMEFLKRKVDPQYYEDFWKVAGYGGADGRFNSQLKEGIQGTVKSTTSSAKAPPGLFGTTSAAYRLSTDLGGEDGSLHGYTLTFTSGADAGEWSVIHGNMGSDFQLSPLGPPARGVKPGDRFTVSNRDLIAFRELHSHMVECDDPGAADYCRAGKPIAVQRSRERLDGLYENYRPLGRLQGKVIALFGGADNKTWPTLSAGYHRQVQRALGAKTNDHFRIYFFENGVHTPELTAPGDASGQSWGSWAAAEYKALDDVMRWVEQGSAPQTSTEYTFDDTTQIVFPRSAARRKGYQPVVTMTANGSGERLEVRSGEEVTFQVQAEDPDNEVVAVEMDFNGDRKFDEAKDFRQKQVTARFTYRYEKAGTYFPVVKATDSTTSPGAPANRRDPEAMGVQNIATLRIVVR